MIADTNTARTHQKGAHCPSTNPLQSVTGTLLDRRAYEYQSADNASEDHVLAYLDALCNALLSRNIEALRDLLKHPLAAALPESVVAEVQQVLAGQAQSFRAPIHALQLYHQTAHLLGVCSDVGARASEIVESPREERARQMELPLAVRVA